MIDFSSYEGTIVIAHRGGSELFFENTLTAFRMAQDLGVDAIECDVHLSKDKHLVVIHDPDLKRISGIDQRVSDLTFEEISQIDLKNGEHVPSLEQVLREIDVPIVVELKSPETMSALLDLFDRSPQLIEKCVVISFFHEALLLLKARYPSIVTGALLAGFPVDPVSVVKSCKADIISLYHEGITKDYVDRCHKGGVKVSVWAPSSEKEIDAVIKAGVDAIGSDRPDLVLQALGRKKDPL